MKGLKMMNLKSLGLYFLFMITGVAAQERPVAYGDLDHPVLFVHGIWSSMEDFGVNGNVTTNFITGYFNNENKGAHVLSEPIPRYIAEKQGFYHASYLNNNGIEFFNAFNDDDLIVNQSTQLYNRLEAVLDEYYPSWRIDLTSKIDIVAHSQGGVVTRHMIRNNRNPDMSNPVNHINHLVTIDSPHSGVKWSTLLDKFNLIPKLPGGLEHINPLKKLREKTNPLRYILNMIQDGLYQSAIQFDRNGELIKSLQGNPTRPIDGQYIPFTAMRGKTPGLFRRLVNEPFNELKQDCRDIISYHESVGNGTLLAKAAIPDVDNIVAGKCSNPFSCAGRVWDDVWDGSTDAVKKFGGDVADFGIAVGDGANSTWEGVKYVGTATYDGVEYVVVKTKDGGEYIIEKIKDGGESVIENACEGGVSFGRGMIEPWVEGLEDYFFNESDMMIDWDSQSGSGGWPYWVNTKKTIFGVETTVPVRRYRSALDQNNPAFRVVTFSGMTPHGNSSSWADLVGSNYRGTEVYNALINPPKTWVDLNYADVTWETDHTRRLTPSIISKPFVPTVPHYFK